LLAEAVDIGKAITICSHFHRNRLRLGRK